MIDTGLFVLMVILGVVAYVMGWISCRLFHASKEEAKDFIQPCETIDDIIKREG